jgi:hypothetical protein
MAYLMFMDESGSDHQESPYEVLAGLAVEDCSAWSLINAIQKAEGELFDRRISAGVSELKGKELLKRKTFRLAGQMPPIDEAERRHLAAALFDRKAAVTKKQLTAFGQAKLVFVGRVLELCAQHQVRVFASIVDRDVPRPPGKDFLRKDYSYLFERFYYFLTEQHGAPQGLLIFDELEKSRSRILLDQIGRYFQYTAKGRIRASRILPEPFFVHSDLTSLVQIADLIAYIIVWGVRFGQMNRPTRPEIEQFADAVMALRYKVQDPTIAGWQGVSPPIWSLTFIDDLRPSGQN